MKDNQKVYIRGNVKREAEVVKILTDLGGRNSHSLNGKNPNAYYFINPNGIIVNNYLSGSEVFSYVKEFYKEIKLPRWKPKYDENYYYFTDMEGIMVGKWKNNPTDSWRYDFGNCFKSYEETKEASYKVQEILNK